MNTLDEPETTTQQTEKILESRSSHWPMSKDTHGYQFKGGACRGRTLEAEKLSQSSSSKSSADTCSQEQMQAELEELVSQLDSRNSIAQSKGAKGAADKNQILTYQSKDDYEKLQDLLLSNKTLTNSGFHSLGTEELAEGLTPQQQPVLSSSTNHSSDTHKPAQPLSKPFSYFSSTANN